MDSDEPIEIDPEEELAETTQIAAMSPEVRKGQELPPYIKAFLTFTSGPEAGKRIRLSRYRTLFGRQFCDVNVDDSTVSRKHAEIEFIGKDVVLRDLRSTNGTWLRDKRVSEARLQGGDEVRLGDVCMVFTLGADTRVLQGEPDEVIHIEDSLGTAPAAPWEGKVLLNIDHDQTHDPCVARASRISVREFVVLAAECDYEKDYPVTLEFDHPANGDPVHAFGIITRLLHKNAIDAYEIGVRLTRMKRADVQALRSWLEAQSGGDDPAPTDGE